MKSKIGIQGFMGAFCELAAIEFCKRNHLEDYEFIYLINSDNVLKAIEANEIRYGILAIENSQGGVVIETVKALAEHPMSP